MLLFKVSFGLMNVPIDELHTIELKVLRRTGYKGWIASESSLPVDGATVIGIVCILGSLLAAPSLPVATLEACCKILSALEDKIELKATCPLVPRCREFALEVFRNKVTLKVLQDMFRKLEIPWKRHGCQNETTYQF